MSTRWRRSRFTAEEREARRIEKLQRAEARRRKADRAAADPAVAARRDERQRRAAFFDSAAELVPLLSVESETERYFVSTRDSGVGRSLFVDGRREEMGALARALDTLAHSRPAVAAADHVFVDIGANIGTTTLPALVRHGYGTAVACEPDPGNRAILELNLAVNRVADRARVVEAAVSDAPGRANLALSTDNYGDHRVVAGRAASIEGRETIDVELITADALLARVGVEPEHVGLVWVDTQGHEAAVLAGASGLLAAGAPVVFELWAAELDRTASLQRLIDVVGAIEGELFDLRAGGSSGGSELVGEIAAACLEQDRITDLLLVPRR